MPVVRQVRLPLPPSISASIPLRDTRCAKGKVMTMVFSIYYVICYDIPVGTVSILHPSVYFELSRDLWGSLVFPASIFFSFAVSKEQGACHCECSEPLCVG